jgi:hypothetical protein
MKGLTPLSMLAANMPQTPNGTSLNASGVLGLSGGAGGDLQQQLKDDLDQRRKKLTSGFGASGSGGFSLAAGELFGGMR